MSDVGPHPWLVDAFLEHLEWERNLSPATLLAYRREVLSFVAFVESELALELPMQTSPVTVRAYLAHLHSRGLKPRSIGRGLAALRTYFRFLVAEGAIEASPANAVPHPRDAQRTPEIADRYAIEELLEGFPDTSVGRRDRAAVELLYAAGLRVGELVALDLGDVQLGQRMVRVRGKGRKERLVPFGQHKQSKPIFPNARAGVKGLLTRTTPCSSTNAVAASATGPSAVSSTAPSATQQTSTTSIRTRCDTHLQPIFWRRGWIFARSRNFSATAPSPRLRSTPRSTWRI